MRFAAHPLQSAISTLSCAGLLVLAGTFIFMKSYIAAAIVFLITIIYFLLFKDYFGSVRIDENGVARLILGIPVVKYGWNEIKEIGILDTHFVKRLRREHPISRLAFYFSPDKMDSDQRLNMCLKWPPRELITLRYTEKAIFWVRKFYDGEMILFNVRANDLCADKKVTVNLGNFREEQY